MKTEQNDREVIRLYRNIEIFTPLFIKKIFILLISISIFIFILPACSSHYGYFSRAEGVGKTLPADAERTSGPGVNLRPAPPSPPMVDVKCGHGDKYSPSGWQWISWEVCIDYSNPQKLSATYKILDQQYKWGGGLVSMEG